MKKTITFFILAALLFTCGSSVYAAEAAQQESVFTITPRMWFGFISLNDDDDKTESDMMPMYGLTATMAPRNIPNWSFLITGLHGTSDGDIIEVGGGGVLYRGSLDYNRSDIEFLIRYTFPGTGLSLFFGPRYIKLKVTETMPIESHGLTNYRTKDETRAWVGEVGVGFVSQIGESGKHRFFSNFTLGIIDSKWDWSSNYSSLSPPESGSDTAPMIDTNIGYEYLFTNSSSFALRYRLFTNGTENNFGQEKWDVVHGPEIGFSFRF